MDILKIIELIRKELSTFFGKNYSSGVPKVPPHRHNSVDNLPIKSTDIEGSMVTQIIAGTNISVSPSTGIGAVTVNSTATSSPGGNNTDVQFNDSGAFGGNDKFTFNKGTNTLTLDDASSVGSGGSIITGGTSGLQIETADSSLAGDIAITTGTDTSGAGFPGNISITAGNSGTSGSPGAYNGGSVSITAGISGTGVGGDVYITAGAVSSSGSGGNIALNIASNTPANMGYVQVDTVPVSFTPFQNWSNLGAPVGFPPTLVTLVPTSSSDTIWGVSFTANQAYVNVSGVFTIPLKYDHNNTDGYTIDAVVYHQTGAHAGAIVVASDQSISLADLTTSFANYSFSFSSFSLTASNNYAVGIRVGTPLGTGIADVAVARGGVPPSGFYQAGRQGTNDSTDWIWLDSTVWPRSQFIFQSGSTGPNLYFGNGVASFGDGLGILAIKNAVTVPSSDVADTGLLYVDAGALMYRGSGGTVTTIAPA